MDKTGKIRRKEIILFEELGKGSSGTVKRGTYRDREVAIKICLRKSSPKRTKESFKKEVEYMSSLKHENVIRLYGKTKTKDKSEKIARYALVFEYCGRGDLFEMLHAPNRKKLSWKQRFTIARDIARGVDYIHKAKIIHRDIKSPNILINNEFRAKIGDFDLSTRVKYFQGTRETPTLRGSYRWMAPELFGARRKGISVESPGADVYAMGIVMWELCSNDYPWKGFKPLEITSELVKGKNMFDHQEVKFEWPGLWRYLIYQTTKEKLEDRWTAAQTRRWLELGTKKTFTPTDDDEQLEMFYNMKQQFKNKAK